MIRAYKLQPGDTPTPFPVSERWGNAGTDIGRLDPALVLTTDSGRRIVRATARPRRRWKLPFLLTPTERAFFETLHKKVDGATRPFYFIEDTGGPALLVRKEKDFTAPESSDSPAFIDGDLVTLYTYLLDLTEEPATVVL